MKKVLLFAAFIAISSTSAFGESLAAIMLQHNGSVTMFESDKMSAAISAAVKGDTIYLSEGAFVGDFTISKEVCIIGAGQGTLIQGNVTVSIDNTPTLSAHLLDAVNMANYTLTVNKAVKNLKLRKCNFNSISVSANITDLSIDRCRLYNFYPYYVKSGNVLNSYIYDLYGDSGSTNTINYINCNINRKNSYVAATFINCLIQSYDGSANNCVFINTRYSTYMSIGTTSSTQNCYTGGTFSEYTDEATKVKYNTIPSDWLEDNGYLGTDGSIIGMFGGTSPFSLVPNVPTVTESKISVDTANKKLNVTLKVSAN